MPSNPHTLFPIGVRYMLLSALGFALMAACVKEVSQYGIPLMEIIAARAVVSLLLCYLDVRRKGISLLGENKPLLIARGVVGSFALICVYYAITVLPLAEATLIQYLHPAFTAVIALLFLKERIHISTLICIVLSLIGLALMVNPGLFIGQAVELELPWFAVAMGLMGAVGSAIAYVLVRRLSQTEDSSVIIFYFPLIALPLAILLPGESFVMPDLTTLLLLLLVGGIYSSWTGRAHQGATDGRGGQGDGLFLCASGVCGDAWLDLLCRNSYALDLGWWWFDCCWCLGKYLGAEGEEERVS